MKRHLFLSGPAFSGKSRLIREQLGSGLQNAGGFCTELCKAPDGSVLGCAMIPAASAGGVQGLERELFLDMRRFPPAHDSEVFRSLGVRLLDEATWYPYALESRLAAELPILGVVKSREDSEQMRRLLGPGTRFTEFSERLFERLAEDPETELLIITEDAKHEAADAVAAWAAEYADLPGFQERI